MLQQSGKFINFCRFSLLILILAFTVSIFLHTDSAVTQDLGRHLTLGKIIWETKKIPRTNLFSYAYPDFPFINHHWGSEVIFYFINKLFSINGLIFIKLIIFISAVTVLVLFAVKRTNLIFLFLGSTLLLEILRDRREIRPEIFAFLFFSLFLVILYKEKEKAGKLIYLLPLFELLWVNVHISFVFGLALYFLFLGDRFICKKIKKEYLVLGFLMMFSVLLNPHGVKGAIYPTLILQSYGYSIVENQTPFFLAPIMRNPVYFYFPTAVFLSLLVIPVLIMGNYYFETAVLLLTGILSFTAVRHFPFFALSLVYPLPLGITILKKKMINFKLFSKNLFSSLEIILCLVIFGFVIFEIYMLVSNRYYYEYDTPVRAGFGQVNGEKAAVDFFLEHNFSGPIFNSFDNGSYLIYRLYPKERVFVDGRPEAYPVSFFQEIYIPMQEDDNVWQEVAKKYKFRTIIFPHTDMTPWGMEFLSRIVKDNDWNIVYFDSETVMLVRKDFLPRGLIPLDSIEKISQAGITQIKNTQEPDVLVRLANLFSLINLNELSETASYKAKTLKNR